MTEPATEESLWDLSIGYLGLGMSCEFGLMQRYCGAEPLDLFRFGYMPLDGLLAQIDAGFKAFTDLSMLTIEPDKYCHEFVVRERTSGITLHTEKYLGQSSVHEVTHQEFRRIPRLVRKLMQELASGERIVVYCQEKLEPNEVAALHDALSRHGPLRLLVVSKALKPDDVGCVVRLADRSMMGYLDQVQPLRFARYPSVDVWLAILRVTDRMSKNDSVPAGAVWRPRESDFDVPSNVEAHLFWRALGNRRRGNIALAVKLFAEYRRQIPDPRAFGCEFDAEFQWGG
jgi:hypothetical protein